jgi:membrane protein involved in colicin uptake
MGTRKVKGKAPDGSEVEVEIDEDQLQDGAGDGDGDGDGDGQQQEQVPDWETVYADMTPAEQKAYNASVAGLKSALDKERKDAKDAKKKAAEAESAKAKQDDANLTELERATKAAAKAQQDLEGLQATVKRERAETALRTAAVKAGMSDPEDAVTMIAASELEWDSDDAKVVNADVLVKNLVAKKPYLVKVIDDAGRGAPPKGGQRKTSGGGQKPPVPPVTF